MLPAGTTINTFTSVDQNNISESEKSLSEAERCIQQTWEVQEHIEAMFRHACKDCAVKEHKGQLAEFLTRYQTVFSQNNQNIGRTELIHHSIPTLEGPRSIH